MQGGWESPSVDVCSDTGRIDMSEVNYSPMLTFSTSRGPAEFLESRRGLVIWYKENALQRLEG